MLLWNCAAVVLANNDTAQCFKRTEIMIGRKSTSQLELVVTPSEELSQFCQSLNGSVSTAELTIEGITGLVPKSEQLAVNMSNSTLWYTFQLNDENGEKKEDKFNKIQERTMAKYDLEFSGPFPTIPLSGLVQQIYFRTLDSTTCWSESTIEYFFSAVNPYFKINVTPNDCDVGNTVDVSLQYYNSQEHEWISVTIQPYKHAPAGKENEYYTNDKNYIHKNVKHFVQYLTEYEGTTPEEKLMHQKAMQDMFYYFLENRGMRMKLVIETKVNNIPSEFYSYMTDWEGLYSDCHTSLEVHQARNNITLSVPGKMETDECKQLLTQAKFIDVTVYLQEGNKTGHQQTVTVQSDFFEKTNLLGFQLAETWPVNTSEMAYHVYMDYYYKLDNGTYVYITETTHSGDVEKNCVADMYLWIRSKQVCASVFLNQFPHADGEAGYCMQRFGEKQDSVVRLYAEDERDAADTRKYYMYTDFTMPAVENYYAEFCFEELPTTVRQIEAGGLYERGRAFVHTLYRDGAAKTTGVYANDKNSFILSNIALEAHVGHLAVVAVPAALSALLVGLGIWFQVRQR